MPTGWSRIEVEATVASYLAMLQAELAGTAYSKAEQRRSLLPLLNGRSEQSIEFKYANISAVLIEIGFPFISGYKPRSNYQKLLLEVVLSQLQARAEIQKLAATDVEKPATVPTVENILESLMEPPRPVELINHVASPIAPYPTIPINYLERETRNNSLGLAGEKFVINFERARLIRAGRENLASKIVHISQTRGDSSGFDILSFDQSGAERFIEVKTTKYGAHTPFFVSRNELEVSKAKSKCYWLYRVYEFRNRPLVFTLRGAFSTRIRFKGTNTLAVDNLDKATRSRVMRSNRSKGTRSTEAKFRSLLARAGLRGWKLGHRWGLPGDPDFIFPRVRLAIFIDGCFWHGCRRCRSVPVSNRQFWEGKIAKNRKRDRQVVRELSSIGWNVFRCWEHELAGDPTEVLKRVREFAVPRKARPA